MQYVPNCLQVANAEIAEVNGRYTSTGLQSFAKDKWILFRDGDYWKVSMATDKTLYYFITSSKSFVSDILVKKWTYSPVSLSAKFLPSLMTISLVPVRSQDNDSSETDSAQLQAEEVIALQRDLENAQKAVKERDTRIALLERELQTMKEKSADVRTHLQVVLSRIHKDDEESVTEEDSAYTVTPPVPHPSVSDDKITALEQTVSGLSAKLSSLMEVLQSHTPRQED